MGEIRTSEGAVIGYYHQEKNVPTIEDRNRILAEANERMKDFRTPAPFRYPSTADDLVEFAKDYFNGCIEVMKQRNSRYARPNDPFYNLKRGGGFGVAVRLDDKISRLLNLTKHEATIDEGHESIEDTCLDIATYAMLLSAMRANERGSK